MSDEAKRIEVEETPMARPHAESEDAGVKLLEDAKRALADLAGKRGWPAPIMPMRGLGLPASDAYEVDCPREWAKRMVRDAIGVVQPPKLMRKAGLRK